MSDYRPYILVRPLEDETTDTDLEQFLLQGLYQGKEYQYHQTVTGIEETQMTPVVGFHNQARHRLFRLYLSNIGKRRKVQTALEASASYLVVQPRVTDTMRLFQETGWRLQRWYRLTFPQASRRSGWDSLRLFMVQMQDSDAMPPMTCLTLRVHARSSTATRSNMFAPDWSIPDDTILHPI